MAKQIRIGRVSSIDYQNGMIRATYMDMDDDVTVDFPVFSFTDEYKMPEVGDEVAVLHLSNGTTAGVVLGRYWNKDNKPAKYGKGVFRKELAHEPGEAYIQYTTDSKTIDLYAREIKFIVDAGSITVSELIELKNRVERLESYH